MTNIMPWDAADHIETPDMAVAYLEAALEENDAALFVAAIGDIVRSRGMTAIAQRANLKREGLYRSLAEDGNPHFATVFAVIDALGLRMRVAPKASGTAEEAVPA